MWIGYRKWSFWIYCNFCDIVSAVCSQDWRDIREESAVAVNSCCQDVCRRELSLRYHNGWEFSCFLLQCAFGYCTVLMLAVPTTVSGNLLPYIVTPLDVTTWHGAVDRHRTFYTLQNARQQHCKHHSDSGQQVSSLCDIAVEVTAVCLLKVSVLIITWHCGFAGINKCIR